MKYIKSRCIQEAKGKKKGKYILTLEVSDYDLNMIENLFTTTSPFVQIEEPSIENDFNGKYEAEFNKKYSTWIGIMWHEFWKTWNKHDKF